MKLTLILFAALLLVGAGYYAYLGSQVFRSQLIDYVPTPDTGTDGTRRHVNQIKELAESVHWNLADGTRQRAFFVPSSNGALVVYAHGAPGSAVGFYPEALAMAKQGYGALLVDLPGYGESEGRRDWGPAFQESIHKAVDFAAAQESVDAGRIAGLGYSMSTYTMARAAVDDERLAAIVLLAGFTTFAEHVHVRFKRRVPGMGYFGIAAAYSQGVDVPEMDAAGAVAKLPARPVLVISGTADHAIPAYMAEALAEAAGEGELWLIEGAGHAGFAEASDGAFYPRLHQFLSKALLQSSAVPTDTRTMKGNRLGKA